jgi:hypothetical protein
LRSLPPKGNYGNKEIQKKNIFFLKKQMSFRGCWRKMAAET